MALLQCTAAFLIPNRAATCPTASAFRTRQEQATQSGGRRSGAWRNEEDRTHGTARQDGVIGVLEGAMWVGGRGKVTGPSKKLGADMHHGDGGAGRGPLHQTHAAAERPGRGVIKRGSPRVSNQSSAGLSDPNPLLPSPRCAGLPTRMSAGRGRTSHTTTRRTGCGGQVRVQA